MQRIIILLQLLSLCVFMAEAGDSFSKEQKEVCRTLKKSLGAKNVEPFGNCPEDPFYDFYVKDGLHGIADREGNIILPARYDAVMYFPSFNTTSLSIPMLDDKGRPTGKSFEVSTKPSDEAFWGVHCEQGAELYDQAGNRIAAFPHNTAVYNGNYIYFSHAPFTLAYEYPSPGQNQITYMTLYRKQGYGHGMLVLADGKVVIPEVDNMTIENGNPCVIYSVLTDNGMDAKGMKRLDGLGFDIPAQFYNVIQSKGEWLVQARATDPFSVPYDPTQYYNTTIHDNGEALFAKHKYDEVLEFYANEGLAAPWAKFYSGVALLKKNIGSINFYKNIVEAMEKGSGLPANENKVLSDADVIMQSLDMSRRLLTAYLGSDDTTFAREARDELQMIDYYTNDMTAYQSRYNAIRSHAAMVTSQEQARQAAAIQALISTFTNALNAATTTTPAQNRQVSSGSVASSSNSSPAPEAKADNSDRKAFLRNQIADWKNKMAKAEASYRQALSSGDDTWEKKRVIDSKRNSVDECLNMIRQYEAELNSLK